MKLIEKIKFSDFTINPFQVYGEPFQMETEILLCI